MEEFRLELPGHRVMVIRPMSPSDAPAMEGLYARLREEDVYKRFFSSRPPPSPFVAKMAAACETGGYGVVATVAATGEEPLLVAEAAFTPLPDGSAEVGITVDPRARGWLGPYLLDILVSEARRLGIANLQAEVLATNRQMQALLEARGSAVIDHSDRPAVVKLVIGTTGRSPAWAAGHERPRLLVEAAGGRWRSTDAARRAGFEVLLCPGVHRKLTRCPALAGRPCPLAAGADVIVDALRDEAGGQLAAAHHLLHPGVPVCVDIPTSLDDAEVIEMLQRRARPARDLQPWAAVGGAG